MQQGSSVRPPGQGMAAPAGGLPEDLQIGQLRSWWAKHSVMKLLLFSLLLALLCLLPVLWGPKRGQRASVPGRRPFLCAPAPFNLLAAMHAMLHALRPMLRMHAGGATQSTSTGSPSLKALPRLPMRMHSRRASAPRLPLWCWPGQEPASSQCCAKLEAWAAVCAQPCMKLRHHSLALLALQEPGMRGRAAKHVAHGCALQRQVPLPLHIPQQRALQRGVRQQARVTAPCMHRAHQPEWNQETPWRHAGSMG